MSDIEMTTAKFWSAAFERAVKTAAQSVIALVGTGAVGITTLDWAQISSIAATAAVISILTSLASDRIGAPGPSLVGEAKMDTPTPEVTQVLPVLSATNDPSPVAETPKTGGAVNDMAARSDPAHKVAPPAGTPLAELRAGLYGQQP